MSNPFGGAQRPGGRPGPPPSPFSRQAGQGFGPSPGPDDPYQPGGQGSPFGFGNQYQSGQQFGGSPYAGHGPSPGRRGRRYRSNNYGPAVPGTASRRGRTMLVFGLVAVVGLVLVGCLLGLRSQFDSSASEPPGAEPVPPARTAEPSRGPSERTRARPTEPVEPSGEPSTETSSEPSSQPSSEPSAPTEPRRPVPSQPDRGGAVPPPDPQRTTVPAGHEVLTDNSVYQAVPQPTDCGQTPTRFSGDTSADLAPLNAYLDCVIAADADAAGLFPGNVRPKIVPYRGNISSPCGMGGQQQGWTAYYCSANQSIYYDVELAQQFSTQHDPWYPLVLMGHEYGHYVQNQAGILGAAQTAWEDDSTLVSRRQEQQAECFGGVVIGQAGLLPQLDPVWDSWEQQNGGLNTHGSYAARARWMKRGAHADNYASCNTWDVAAREVAGPN